jgi:hypothetical protein
MEAVARIAELEGLLAQLATRLEAALAPRVDCAKYCCQVLSAWISCAQNGKTASMRIATSEVVAVLID